jgi:hypothetical protein
MVKRRLQFDFSEDAVTRLDELATRLDASSRAEVVRRALLLLDRVMDAEKAGGTVLVRAHGKDRELVRW